MAITLRTPPRLAGQTTEQQMASISNYMDELYQAARLAISALSGIRQVGLMATAISNPPTQAEVEAIRDHANEIVAACAGAELS